MRKSLPIALSLCAALVVSTNVTAGTSTGIGACVPAKELGAYAEREHLTEVEGSVLDNFARKCAECRWYEKATGAPRPANAPDGREFAQTMFIPVKGGELYCPMVAIRYVKKSEPPS